jgi:site-specific recombinase XerD
MAFAPQQITTPLLTQYRSYLQTVRRMHPTTINRILVGLKRYCAWATEAELLERDPAWVVKLIPQVKGAPQHNPTKPTIQNTRRQRYLPFITIPSTFQPARYNVRHNRQ